AGHVRRDQPGRVAAIARAGRTVEAAGDDHLSAFLMTFLSADQTSSTAQTLTSTRPWPRANSRMMFSLRSVDTPGVALGEVLLGHATQSAPAGVVRGWSTVHRADSRFNVVQKVRMTSYGPEPARRRASTSSGSSSISNPAGAPSTRRVVPGRTPSFRASGVPE